MLNIDEYQEYIDLHKEKEELDARLKKIKKRIDNYQKVLIDNLLQNNMQKVTVGDKTAYVRSQIWAKISDKQKAIDALVSEGYQDYVKPAYNSHQVSKLLRELDEREEELPDAFKGVIEPVAKTTLNVINA